MVVVGEFCFLGVMLKVSNVVVVVLMIGVVFLVVDEVLLLFVI